MAVSPSAGAALYRRRVEDYANRSQMKDMHGPARRFRVLLLAALAAATVLTPLALWYLAASGTVLHLHLVIALALAITLSLLLAAGLMSLVFFSAASGHDARVAEENAAHDEVWRDPS